MQPSFADGCCAISLRLLLWVLLSVAGTTLLCTLNELLSRTAVMVQPLVYLHQLPDTTALDTGSPTVAFVDVPLPLCHAAESCPPTEGQQGSGTQPTAEAEVLSVHSHPGVPVDPSHRQQLLHGTGKGMAVFAVDRQQDGKLQQVTVPAAVVEALAQLQLDRAVGWVRLVRLPAAPSSSSIVGSVPTAPGKDGWRC
jgi:hypothetical protein